jgi:ATP-dependent Clp protease ATP-binding subunit ClpA
MFERFTKRARAAVTAARDEAQTGAATRIGAHHLLLGMLRDDECLAARTLASLGARPEQVRASIVRHAAGWSSGPVAPGVLDEEDVAALRTLGIDAEEVLRRAAADLGGLPAGRQRGGRLPLDAEAKQALELSLREAISLKHKYIGTEHLLLGLLRGRSPVVAAVAAELGVTHDNVRAVVLDILRRTG